MALINDSEKDKQKPDNNLSGQKNKKPEAKSGENEDDHEKFSPGEPEDYNAEEFSTD